MPTNFDDDLKEFLNKHVVVSYPGSENGGFFPEIERAPIAKSKFHLEEVKETPKLDVMKGDSDKSDFDPIKSMEEEYDIRKAKTIVAPIQAVEKTSRLLKDPRYELKTLRFKKDKFEIKTFEFDP
jgi:hypothetical protein